jgi:hypothetical protein
MAGLINGTCNDPNLPGTPDITFSLIYTGEFLLKRRYLI